MIKIEHGGQLYAMLVSPEEDAPKQGSTTWLAPNHMSLQGSLMNYESGKTFRMHRHKLNPRMIKRTQECFVVVRGKIMVTIRKDKDSLNEYLYAGPGDAIFVWSGFHGLNVLQNDTLMYELKAGCWDGDILEDKEFV